MITVGPRASVPVPDATGQSVRTVASIPAPAEAERISVRTHAGQEPGIHAERGRGTANDEPARKTVEHPTPADPRIRFMEDDPRLRRPMLALPERSLPDLPSPEPAGPLRTFAQVPTELMQELTRLRSAELPAAAVGVPGRRDPTPIPAPSDAIAPRAADVTPDITAGKGDAGESGQPRSGR